MKAQEVDTILGEIRPFLVLVSFSDVYLIWYYFRYY
jgi:hypothetical protein